MLCHDCDAVFHKALHKRSHIRLSRGSTEEFHINVTLRNELLNVLPADWQAIFQEASVQRAVETKSPIALWTLVGVLTICLRFMLNAMKVTWHGSIFITEIILPLFCVGA